MHPDSPIGRVETTGDGSRDSTPAWQVFGIPAVLALIGYLVFYSCDARFRTRRGPWEVVFLRESDGTPALVIAQPSLGISNVQVRFVGEHVPDSTVDLPFRLAFDEPRKPVPFGEVVFDDLMYQPGTVVLHCFGHEVQMLPRALYLNREARSWAGSGQFNLGPEAKPSRLEAPPRRGPSPSARPN